jgi:serine/threonine-protein kinase
VIVEAEPDPVEPVESVDLAESVAASVTEGDLVILPLDSDIAPDVPVAADTGLIDEAVVDPSQTVGADQTSLVEPVVAGSGAAATATRAMAVMAPSEPPPRRRGFPWKIVLALLVVAALAVLGVLATRLFATPVYTVPDLVEMPEAEARNLIAANQWEVSVDRERSDLVPIVGRVVRTVPQSGVELAEGEPFLMVVSDGPTLRELPESTGLTLPEAQTRLVERGLDVLPPIEQFDEVVPDGVVIEWSVPGDATLTTGALVEPATSVQLVVSLGPAPRAIPNVVGLTVGAARGELEAIGLTLTEAGQEFSDDIVLGSVIRQGTEPGTEVARGSDLTVVVSKGPDIVPFPDISGAADFNEAAAILAEAGFSPRLTFGDAEGQVQTVRIDGEEPVVGETYRRGTQVDIRAL